MAHPLFTMALAVGFVSIAVHAAAEDAPDPSEPIRACFQDPAQEAEEGALRFCSNDELPNACYEASADGSVQIVKCLPGQESDVCVDSGLNQVPCPSTEWLTSDKLITIGGSILVPIVTLVVGALLQTRRLQRGYRPRRIKKGERKNTILQIGVGRVGKSQLVTSIRGNDGKPERVTEKFEIHTFAVEGDRSERIRFFIDDYRGQDFAQLVSSFVQEQLRPYSELRYGDINSLVLVVDLFRDEDPKRSFKDLDEDRIESQIAEWNRTALDAVFGLLTRDQLTYVCIFINKVDKWASGLSKAATMRAAKTAYQPLVSEVKRRTDQIGADLHVIVGSALAGTGVIGDGGLLPALKRHSVPLSAGGD